MCVCVGIGKEEISSLLISCFIIKQTKLIEEFLEIGATSKDVLRQLKEQLQDMQLVLCKRTMVNYALLLKLLN